MVAELASRGGCLLESGDQPKAFSSARLLQTPVDHRLSELHSPGDLIPGAHSQTPLKGHGTAQGLGGHRQMWSMLALGTQTVQSVSTMTARNDHCIFGHLQPLIDLLLLNTRRPSSQHNGIYS